MKIYLFNPESGVYLGEDFTDDPPIRRCARGARLSLLMPLSFRRHPTGAERCRSSLLSKINGRFGPFSQRLLEVTLIHDSKPAGCRSATHLDRHHN
jgi:hypothetical protein